MNKNVKDLFKEAKSNKQFKNDLIKNGLAETALENFYGDKVKKNIYIAIYTGWKIGRYGK